MKILKIEIPLAYSTENEKNKSLVTDSYSIGAKAIANFRNIGRFEFDGTYTRVEIDTEDAFVPYVIAGGKKPGDNFTVLISTRFKLNSYSRVELRYTHKKLGDGYSNSILRLEARAEF